MVARKLAMSYLADLHHSICDFISRMRTVRVVSREMSSVNLPSVQITRADFASWLRNGFAGVQSREYLHPGRLLFG